MIKSNSFNLKCAGTGKSGPTIRTRTLNESCTSSPEGGQPSQAMAKMLDDICLEGTTRCPHACCPLSPAMEFVCCLAWNAVTETNQGHCVERLSGWKVKTVYACRDLFERTFIGIGTGDEVCCLMSIICLLHLFLEHKTMHGLISSTKRK